MAHNKTILELNQEKIMELRPEVRHAGIKWVTHCHNIGLRFRIIEAYRSQARQIELYAKGRTKPGPIVTYTRDSNHTRRLAVDVKPLNCDYQDIAEVAILYDIIHPFTKGRFIDLPHFEMTKVKPPELKLSAEAKAKRLQRAIERSERDGLDPPLSLLKRQKSRLRKRIVRNEKDDQDIV